MKIRWLPLVLCVLLLSACAPRAAQSPEAPYTFTDDLGLPVTLSKKPETVAVLTSSLADLWITAGGQVDITVGETAERGFAGPDAVLVDDGAGKTINLELLIASEPDFVLYSAELSGQVACADALHDAGIPAAGFQVDTFSDYLKLLKICTDILETPEAYEAHGTNLQKRVEELTALAQDQQDTPSILFVRAGSSAKYTKAKNAQNHFVCVMLQELGVHNIADDAPILLDGLSTEQILLCDPDAVLFTTMGDESAGTAYMDSLFSDPVYQTLSAVKNGAVYQLPKDLFQYKPNARWDEAYAYLIDLLYGDIL